MIKNYIFVILFLMSQNTVAMDDTAGKSIIANYFSTVKRKLTQSFSRNVTQVDNDCSICFEPLQESWPKQVSICNNNDNINGSIGHHFHAQCLIQWFNQSTTCPLCRNNISQGTRVKVMGSAYFDLQKTINKDTVIELLNKLEAPLNQMEEEHEQRIEDLEKKNKKANEALHRYKKENMVCKRIAIGAFLAGISIGYLCCKLPTN